MSREKRVASAIRVLWAIRVSVFGNLAGDHRLFSDIFRDIEQQLYAQIMYKIVHQNSSNIGERTTGYLHRNGDSARAATNESVNRTFPSFVFSRKLRVPLVAVEVAGTIHLHPSS